MKITFLIYLYPYNPKTLSKIHRNMDWIETHVFQYTKLQEKEKQTLMKTLSEIHFKEL